MSKFFQHIIYQTPEQGIQKGYISKRKLGLGYKIEDIMQKYPQPCVEYNHIELPSNYNECKIEIGKLVIDDILQKKNINKHIKLEIDNLKKQAIDKLIMGEDIKKIRQKIINLKTLTNII